MTAIAYIDTSTALDAGIEEGFTTDPNGVIYGRLCNSLKWGEREPLEVDESKLQLIPYVLVWRPGEVFLTQRLEGGSEERLHGQVSAGIGGHVEACDRDHMWYQALSECNAHWMPGENACAISKCAEREMLEEVFAQGWREQDLSEPHGFIYDTSSAVSRVHLGVVFTLRVDDCEVRETEVLRGWWCSAEDLAKAKQNPKHIPVGRWCPLGGPWVYWRSMESWARIALEHIDDLIGDYAATGE